MYLVLVLFYVNFNNTLCGTILQIRKKHFIEIPGIDSSFPFAASLIATETTLSVFIINGRLITGMLSFPPIVSKNGVSTGNCCPLAFIGNCSTFVVACANEPSNVERWEHRTINKVPKRGKIPSTTAL